MKKVKVKIIQCGILDEPLNYNIIKKFKSSAFEITEVEEGVMLENMSNGYDYSTYEDNYWEKKIKGNDNILTFVITNVQLEGNFYARHLNHKRVIFSFRQILTYLTEKHIKLENVILKALYEYSLVFPELRKGYEELSIWHNETRGCLYDIDGVLSDIVRTCKEPKICVNCESRLLQKGLSAKDLQSVKQELKKIKRSRFLDMYEWGQKHIILSMFLGSVFSFVLGLFTSFVYDLMK